MDCDYLIVGAGIIGITIAKGLIQENKGLKIIVIEKEDEIAFHASGRNSGVLHAGFYYTADSLKARFTRDGCIRLSEYCIEKKLPISNIGKLVVAQTEQDLPQIDVLLSRAKQNGVELHEISEKEARSIEPNVKFHKRVLWSPRTSVVNPKLVLSQMAKDIEALGVKILFKTSYIKRKGHDVCVTSNGPIKFQYIINCAGLYADKVANDFGFSQKFRLLPFKGLYLKSKKPLPEFLKTNIYPVPNLNNPFLGVHFTVTVDGYVKIGPTAIPAFWREQYKGFDRFSISEFFEVFYREMGLVANANFDFFDLAVEEFKKYRKSYMVSIARNLVQSMDNKDFDTWGPSGIRAQLLNIETKKLEMDYVYEGDKNSFHVLNAVSPAFTSSLPFSEYLIKEINSLRSI